MSIKLPKIILHRRRLVAENLRFNLYFDHIEAPDGREVENFLVVAPKVKTGNLVTGVTILPILGDKVGLIRLYRHPIEAWTWEAPRGFIDHGETVEAAAMRELAEETGLSCQLEDLLSYGTYSAESGTLAARMNLFVAQRCVQLQEANEVDFGHIELCFFDFESVARMIKLGEIEDPGTMLAYYRYKNND